MKLSNYKYDLEIGMIYFVDFCILKNLNWTVSHWLEKYMEYLSNEQSCDQHFESLLTVIESIKRPFCYYKCSSNAKEIVSLNIF